MEVGGAGGSSERGGQQPAPRVVLWEEVQPAQRSDSGRPGFVGASDVRLHLEDRIRNRRLWIPGRRRSRAQGIEYDVPVIGDRADFKVLDCGRVTAIFAGVKRDERITSLTAQKVYEEKKAALTARSESGREPVKSRIVAVRQPWPRWSTSPGSAWTETGEKGPRLSHETTGCARSLPV